MKGIAAALRRLDNLQKQVNKIPNEVYEYARSLAITMESDYTRASNEGVKDISVYAEKTPEGCRIVGTGSEILFVEFGTGIIYPHTSPIDHPYNFAGSWSIGHAQYLTDSDKLAKHKGQWPYNGKWVDGMPSANVFYEAGKTVEQELPKYAAGIVNRALK